MIKNTKKTVVLIIIIFIIALSGTAFAANNNYKVTIEGNKKEIYAGEKLEFDIKVTDIDKKDGLTMFSAMTDYNSDVFNIKIEGDDKGVWVNNGQIENYFVMATEDLSPKVEDQVVAKIIVTANDDVPTGTQTISLTKINIATNQGKSISVEDQKISLLVKGVDYEEGEQTEQSIQTEESTNNNTAIKIIMVVSIILVVIFFIVIIFSYIKFVKSKKENN